MIDNKNSDVIKVKVKRKRRQIYTNRDIKLGDFYKRMRLKLWFDFENIDLSSEEIKRLETQTRKAADKLSAILRGLCIQ